ncbi:MAG: hypothetical protein JEY97_14545 [Bacteroidales bacterium]|nr:hypothetical protein [Bacteroidales bacterium]
MESIKKTKEIAKEEIKIAINTYFQVLISKDEGPNFAMRKFTIEPGGRIP